MRTRRVVLVVVGLAVGMTCLAARSSAADQGATDKTAPAERLVHEALLADLDGKQDERARLLAAALAADPEYAPARWQSGYVRLDDAWVAVDEAPRHFDASPQLSRYRKMRDGMVDTADNQRALARWCHKNNLPDESRIHWVKVLQYEPQNAEAMDALGLKWHDGRLMTPEQISEERKAAGKRLQAMRHWAPLARKWRTAIERGNAKASTDAVQSLQDLSDPAALPALESVFANDAEGKKADRLNLLLVEAADRIQHPEATNLLLRRAVLSDSDKVRLAACEALKKRPLHDFVPQLIAAMPDRVKTRYHLTMLADGSVFHHHEVEVDGQRGKSTFVSDSLHPFHVERGARIAPRAAATELGRAAAIERSAASHNAAAERLRGRLIGVLERTTGFSEPDDPELWRKQYAEYYGWADYVDEHPERKTYSHNISLPPIIVAPSRLLGCSCFPAGTDVLTMTGPTPIETIKPGDRVLAQDLRTGELTYTTVQNPTMRPPVDLVEIHFAGSSITSTYGHPYWVVGKGWRVAGHLDPGDRLRGLNEDAVVKRVEEVPSREVYNLLVGELATYFVGPQQLLVHDDSRLRSVPVALPGLAIRDTRQ